MASELRQLLKIISDGIDLIEAEATKRNTTFPSLSDIFNPTSPGEQLASDPAIITPALVVASAASQLAATVKFPGLVLFDRVMAFHITSCIRSASEAGIVEILREAGPDGLHVEEIAAKTGTDPAVTGRILRLLATHYVFREVKPDVFTNNRISSMSDTGKDSKVVVELAKKSYANSAPGNPVNNIQADKYENTSGLAAIIESCADECFKASAYMTEAFIANDKLNKGFKRAYNPPGNFFEFMDAHPGYMGRLQANFGGASKLEPMTAILHGFDWKSLPPKSLVVDIGGGNGSLTELIASHAGNVNMMIQDRDAVIEHVTKPYWNETKERQALVKSARVQTKAQDFFQPQASDLAGKIDMFLLRYILHDWPTDMCKVILKNLHAATKPGGRILIVDFVIPYACDASGVGADIPGASAPPVPAPLLANLGEANGMAYFADLQMENLLGGQERTLGEMIALTSETGWKIVKVYSPPGSGLKQVECVKV